MICSLKVGSESRAIARRGTSIGRTAAPFFCARKSLEGAKPIVKMARPLQIWIPLGAVSAKVTTAARATAVAINHFDFHASDATNFKTLPASGAVLES
jgi:hypothetical protein